MEGWLQVSKLVVCALGKAWTTPGDVAGIGGWETSTFGDEVSGVESEAEFSLDGFGDPSNGQERWIPAASKDAEHGGRVDSGVMR